MTFKSLYIIGNGFDLYHEIHSKFSDFKAWYKKRDLTNCASIESYFKCDDLWSDFETNLTTFDSDKFAEERKPWFESDCAWYNRVGEYNIGSTRERTQELHEWWNDICGELRSWSEHINDEMRKNARRKLMLQIDDSLFLTFNYTETLERIYDVPQSQILHIHGCVNISNPLIIGHDDHVEWPSYMKDDVIDFDAPAKDDILDELAEWRKPVDELIEQHSGFWDKLKYIDQVIVLGFSFGDVDKPYIEKIIDGVSIGATWRVSGRDDVEAADLAQAVRQMAKSKKRMLNIAPLRWSEISSVRS